MAFLKSSQITGLSAKDVDVRGFTQAANIKLGERAYTEHEVLLADSYSIVGDVTVSENLILSKLSDDGDDITITGDTTTRTISGSGSLEGSTFAQTPNASMTGMTGVLGSAVTGGSGLTALGTVATGNLSNTAIVYPTGRYISRWTNAGTSSLATGVPLELDSQVADTSLFTHSSGLFTCVKAGLYLFCAQFATGTPASQWGGWAKNYSGAAGSFGQSHFTVRAVYSRSTDTAYLPKLVVNTIRCATSDVMSVRGTGAYAYALDQTSITITYLAP
jgi:hypothetical protein